MIEAVNATPAWSTARKKPVDVRRDGWYGCKPNRGTSARSTLALVDESRRPNAHHRSDWVSYLNGEKPAFRKRRSVAILATIAERVAAFRKDETPPEKRLADNMARLQSCVDRWADRLMLGALPPSREGGLLNARVRYFRSRNENVPEFPRSAGHWWKK